MSSSNSNNLTQLAKYIEDHKKYIVITCTALVIVLVVLMAIRTISQQPLASDDAINLQAPYNLAKNGTYSSFGAIWLGQDKVFDPYLTTGPVISLPIALAFKLFGASLLQARYIMLGFYLTAIALASWFVYAKTKSVWSILMPITMLLTIDKFINYPTAVLGEFTAIGLVFGSMLAWHRRYFILAGILAATAVLSKFLMLLVIFAGLGFLALRLLKNWRRPAKVLGDGLRYCLGVGLTLGAWEFFRFAQLGFSYHTYLANIREFIIYFRVNGSGLAENATKITPSTKFSMIFANIALPVFAIVIVFGCLLWLGWQNRAYLGMRISQNAYGLTFIGLYGLWWLAMSNGAYIRYVMPLAVIGIGLAYSLVLPAQKFLKPTNAIPLVAILLILILGIYRSYWPLQQPTYPRTLQDQQAVAKRVVSYHPSNLAHVGWWQNSEILFLTGLHSRVTHSLSVGEEYQLLLGPAMHDIVTQDYDRAKKICRQIIFEQNGYIFCNGQIEKDKPVE